MSMSMPVRRSPSSRRRSRPRRRFRRYRKRIAGFLIAAISLTLPIVIPLAYNTENAIDRPSAASFLTYYWSTAPRRPAETWPLLMPQFRAHHESSEDRYRRFFATVTHVQVTGPWSISTNTFRVRLKLTYNNGRSAQVSADYTLKCVSFVGRHRQGATCPLTKLRIFDGTSPLPV